MSRPKESEKGDRPLLLRSTLRAVSAKGVCPLFHYMLLQSTGVARFAAETSFQSDRAATAASRVSHALDRLMEEGQLTLQHGLERWLVRHVGWHDSVPNRGTRDTPDTYLLSNP